MKAERKNLRKQSTSDLSLHLSIFDGFAVCCWHESHRASLWPRRHRRKEHKRTQMIILMIISPSSAQTVSCCWPSVPGFFKFQYNINSFMMLMRISQARLVESLETHTSHDNYFWGQTPSLPFSELHFILIFLLLPPERKWTLFPPHTHIRRLFRLRFPPPEIASALWEPHEICKRSELLNESERAALWSCFPGVETCCLSPYITWHCTLHLHLHQWWWSLT